jgi:hypothetical protein
VASTRSAHFLLALHNLLKTEKTTLQNTRTKPNPKNKCVAPTAATARAIETLAGVLDLPNHQLVPVAEGDVDDDVPATRHNIIEAPWLVNDGHGAPLSGQSQSIQISDHHVT